MTISLVSGDAADAEIRNEMVPPGGTLVADAETVTAARVGVPEPARAGPVGAGDGEDEADGEELWWRPAPRQGEEAAGLPVPLAVGADGSAAGPDDPFGPTDAAGRDDTAGLDAAAGADEAEGAPGAGDAGLVETAGWLDAGVLEVGVPGVPDGDGVAEADDATAMTMAVTPLKMRKKPVARISVTGRARMNRMRTPCQSAP